MWYKLYWIYNLKRNAHCGFNQFPILFSFYCCNFPWWLFDWKLGSWPDCPIISPYPKRKKQFQCKWCGRHCACKQNENVSYMKDWGGEKAAKYIWKSAKKGQKKTKINVLALGGKTKSKKKKNATQRMSTEMLITPETTMLLLLLLLLFLLLSLTLCAASILHQVLHCILPTPVSLSPW